MRHPAGFLTLNDRQGGGAAPVSARLTAVGEFEGEDAALVQVELVLVGLGVVQHLHVAALHAHGEPLAGGTVAQREDLQPRRKQTRVKPGRWRRRCCRPLLT